MITAQRPLHNPLDLFLARLADDGDFRRSFESDRSALLATANLASEERSWLATLDVEAWLASCRSESGVRVAGFSGPDGG